MVWLHLIIGTFASYIAWALALFLGSCTLLGSFQDRTESDIAVDFLIASAVGFAELTFGLFLLASAHALFLPWIIALLVILVCAAVFFARRAVESDELINYQRRLYQSLFSIPFLLVLVIVTVLSIPAALPPTLSDSTMYHLAHAIGWAHAGFLELDPFVRFPLAQFNVELLYATFFTLNLGDYAQYVTWIFYALAATGLVIFVDSLLAERGASRLVANTAGLLTALTFLSAPIVTQYADVAYVDIPAGTMLLAFSAAVVRARANFARYGISVAIIAGSFVGMKASLILVAFLALYFIISIGRKQKVSVRTIAFTVVVLAVFSAPWFLRNILISGDPLDPLLNLSLRHSDPFWTIDDVDGQRSNLRHGLFLGAVPILAFLDSRPFIDAVSLSFCFLYIPIICGLVLAFNSRLRSEATSLVILVSIVTLAIFQEVLVTDYLVRYTLHFYALFLALLSLTTWMVFQQFGKEYPQNARALSFGALIAIACFAIPGAGSAYTYDGMMSGFKKLDLGINNPDEYLAENIPGYIDANRLSDALIASGTHAKVLTLNYEYLQYYFRSRGVTQVGDWFGPGRVHDFIGALNSGRFEPYLTSFDIGAVMVPRKCSTLAVGQQQTLVIELRAAGFKDITTSGSPFLVFLRSDIFAVAIKDGLPIRETDLGYEKRSVPAVITTCGS